MSTEQSGESVSILRLVTLLVDHVRALVIVPTVVGIITAVIVMVVPKTYAAGAAFAPESDSKSAMLGSVSGIASQLGIPLGADATRSPEFYADVLRSRAVLEAVLAGNVANSTGSDSVRVAALYQVSGATPELFRDNALKSLYKKIGVSVDRRTNIVRFDVEAPTAQAAKEVADLLLAALIRFNLYSRQGSAHQRREFLERRVAESNKELEDAEEALRDFRENNRSVNSAELRFREQQLQRRATIQGEVYQGLRRAFETARVDEVNDTPPITIIERPVVPGLRLRPKRAMTVIAMGIVSFAFSAMVILLLGRHAELVARGDQDYGGLLERMRSLRNRLRFARG